MQQINYATYEKPSNYMKFKEGESIVRIVSNGVIMRKHAMKTKTRFIPLGECTGENCEQCAKGNEYKEVYIWIIYDKGDHRVKVMEVGSMIGDALCKMAKSIGDPQSYDVAIIRHGVGRDTQYRVEKREGEDLTPEQLSAVKANKSYLTNKYFR